MSKRRHGRIAALQYLFGQDLSGDLPLKADAQSLDDFWALRTTKPEIQKFALELISGVLQHRTDIDRIITRSLHHFEFDRLSTVDRNILRLGVYELIASEGVIPPAVIISEAIAIASEFGLEESSKFVHGVLDQIRKTLNEKTPR